ncbi:YwqG family protein [Geitlerinema sp. PCC 9228]|jgi:uncharacterized protein YwqG|uniref:DUF1963 domain-containing protein n=1 Tax=Geitlerinema sp. PCC 9228 TaxID=111611 RepID=UPI0008F9C330|nr:YwqG family protein [Geitlerinema sp. PCC 9228]
MSLQFLQALPWEFEPLRSWLENQITPYISLQPRKVEHLRGDPSRDPLSFWQSKIGGHPYFPKNYPYPQDKRLGKAMPLLLQIHCSEVPPMEGFDFPNTGILEFYLGLQPANGQFAVLYFPEIIRDREHLFQDFHFIENRATIREIYNEIYSLQFSGERDFFSAAVAGNQNIRVPERLIELYRDFEDWLFDYRGFPIRGSKIAGFPDFHENIDSIIQQAQGRLLLEFKYPNRNEYFYFFIKEKDLQNRHFGAVEFFFNP